MVVIDLFLIEILGHEKKVTKLNEFYKQTIKKHRKIIKSVFDGSRFLYSVKLRDLQVKISLCEIKGGRFNTLMKQIQVSLEKIHDPILVKKTYLQLAYLHV
jgi:hypothetical protein